MGGLPRRAAFIKQIKAQDPPVLILDTGNFISDKPLAQQALEPAGAKAELILKAMDTMGYAAMAVGEKDLYLGLDLLRAVEGMTKVRFLSANLVDSGGRTLFEPHTIVKTGDLKVGVIGLTAPPADMGVLERRMAKALVKEPLQAATDAVKDIRDRCDLIVVLSNTGYSQDLELAESVPGIDVIISGGTKRFMKNPVIRKGTLITSGYYEGRAMGSLAIHLDGDIKGWISRYELDYLETQIRTAETKTGTPAGKRRYDTLVENRASAGLMTVYESDMVSLDPSFPDDPQITALITDYRKGLASRSVSAPGPSTPRSEHVYYTGSEACSGCHQARYLFWRSTDHFKAYDSLMPKNAGADPDCLPCHVTGYERSTGYWPRAPKENLRGVQCEACHGVGSLHAGSPESYSLVHLPLAPQCLDCHTEEQDGDFDYLRDKGKICQEMKESGDRSLESE